MENLSNDAKALIRSLLREGFSPRQIKNAMEDGEYLKRVGISQELTDEIHFFLCNNWGSISKINRGIK